MVLIYLVRIRETQLDFEGASLSKQELAIAFQAYIVTDFNVRLRNYLDILHGESSI